MSLDYYEEELVVAKLKGSELKVRLLMQLISIERCKSNKNPRTNFPAFYKASTQALLDSLSRIA